MRLATLMTTSGPRLHVRAQGGGYVDIATATGDERFAAFETFVAVGPAATEAARSLQGRDGREYPLSDFGPAVPAPERILCLGLNYSEHALEGGRAVPTWPDTFVRAQQTVLGPYADLVKPALTSSFDYEGELGIVIGAGGRYIPAGKAIDAIAGFTVLNDASARDWQRAGSQWTPGKNFDGSMPIGPEVVTRTRSTSPTWRSLPCSTVRSCSRHGPRRCSSTCRARWSSSPRSRRCGPAMSSPPGRRERQLRPQAPGLAPSRGTLSRSRSRALAPSATAWSPSRATAPAGDGSQAPLLAACSPRGPALQGLASPGKNSHRRGDEHDDHHQNTKIRQNRVASIRPQAADRAARRPR